MIEMVTLLATVLAWMDVISIPWYVLAVLWIICIQRELDRHDLFRTFQKIDTEFMKDRENITELKTKTDELNDELKTQNSAIDRKMDKHEAYQYGHWDDD